MRAAVLLIQHLDIADVDRVPVWVAPHLTERVEPDTMGERPGATRLSSRRTGRLLAAYLRVREKFGAPLAHR